MIYLDYNATTPLGAASREAMEPFLARYYGNPSSVHGAGREARAAVDDARDRLPAFLRAEADERIFPSHGTEAQNLAGVRPAGADARRGGPLLFGRPRQP